MPGEATSWWESAATDWSRDDPGRVADVLSYAYPTPEGARLVAIKAGLDPARLHLAGSPREVWVGVLHEAAVAGRALDLAAVVLHDASVFQFHAPLRSLLGDRLGHVSARIVHRYGLPPEPPTGRDAIVESIVESEPTGPEGSSLNTITSVRSGFLHPRAFLKAQSDFIARTVMIEVGGQPAGTGFVVGPNLLLTAAHVFDKFRWPPDPLRPARAVFDFDFAGSSAAETGTPVPISEWVTGSLPTPSEAASGASAVEWNAPEDRLDFALLKLATPAPPREEGEPRGHYELSADAYDFGRNAEYMIMQHPLGGYLQLSLLHHPPAMNPLKTRIRYEGNTLPGSSGSAVVDFRGRLVAIHHFSTPTRNQGIPISIVARQLLNGPHAGLFRAEAPAAASEAVTTVDPFVANAILGRRPFVNRGDLRTTMREMAEAAAGTRTLAIQGESGTGVSYSYYFAMHVASQSTLCAELRRAAPGGLRALKVDLRKYVNVPVERMRAEVGLRLLMDLGIIAAPTDPLAQEARDTLTLVATIGAKLRGSDQQWWLFFDSIDSLVAIKQGEVDELIHGLIDLADEDLEVPLRIVLAGRHAEEFASEHTDWAERDSPSGLTRGDVEGWLQRRAKEDALAIDETKLAAKLSELFPSPGPLPEPRRLGPRLPTILTEVLAP